MVAGTLVRRWLAHRTSPPMTHPFLPVFLWAALAAPNPEDPLPATQSSDPESQSSDSVEPSPPGPDGPEFGPEPGQAQEPPAGPAPQFQIPVRENSLRVFWQDSLRLETEDQQFRLQIGGRVHLDAAFADNQDSFDAAGIDTSDRIAFRRARLHAAGTIYENIDFYAAYEFAEDRVESRGIYLRFPHLFGGNLLVGNFKEPFSLEWLTSSNYLTFIERGLPNALTPGYQTGVMLTGDRDDGALNWAVGLFRAESDPIGESIGDGQNALTARLTYAFEDLGGKDDTLLHLGAAYSRRSLDAYQVAQFPEASTADVFASTGLIAGVERVELVGLEAAGVVGPFSLQAEYISSDVEAEASGDPRLDGWYASASYFLTGESRPYSGGSFRRVRPLENWRGFGQGSGALELAVRYSELDLDEAVQDQTLENLTIGLNWHLNPNTRIQANWIRTDVGLADDDTSIFALRFQVIF